MTVVAFLQNQWFKDPPRMRALFEKHYAGRPNGREDFIRTFLFWSCLTGMRLQRAFGEEMVGRIVWEEANHQIGATSSSYFPPDPEHMAGVIRKHRPHVVLLFGKVAAAGMAKALPRLDQAVCIISGPHPAARGAGTVPALNDMARRLRDQLAVMKKAAATYAADDAAQEAKDGPPIIDRP